MELRATDESAVIVPFAVLYPVEYLVNVALHFARVSILPLSAVEPAFVFATFCFFTISFVV